MHVLIKVQLVSLEKDSLSFKTLVTRFIEMLNSSKCTRRCSWRAESWCSLSSLCLCLLSLSLSVCLSFSLYLILISFLSLDACLSFLACMKSSSFISKMSVSWGTEHQPDWTTSQPELEEGWVGTSHTVIQLWHTFFSEVFSWNARCHIRVCSKHR